MALKTIGQYLLGLYLILSITACSKSEEDNITQNQISPPDWIQGTWLSGSSGFRFTQDDFITIAQNTETSHKGLLSISKESGQDVSVEEDKINNSYRLKMNFSVGQSLIYEFSRQEENIIVWENHALNPEYTKQ